MERVNMKGGTMPKKKPNKLEQSFLDAWSEHKDEGLPDPLFQHEWSPSTKHIADFAWPDYRVLVEMDGGVFTRQAHGSVSGILRTMRCWGGLCSSSRRPI
jgi:very-short-patch-repair endonuclease